jgi:DNA-binding HxlR family transcriptional regulator
VSEGATKAIWMHLLKEGGRWTCAELRDALKEIPGHTVDVTLSRMTTRGLLNRFEKQAGCTSSSYGITRNCKVPYGVHLADLMGAGVVREPA